MAGNRFHPCFLDRLPPWQQDYIAAYQASTGGEAGFALRGGGWYTLLLWHKGETSRQLVRKSQIAEMTAKLQARMPLVAPTRTNEGVSA